MLNRRMHIPDTSCALCDESAIETPPPCVSFFAQNIWSSMDFDLNLQGTKNFNNEQGFSFFASGSPNDIEGNQRLLLSSMVMKNI